MSFPYFISPEQAMRERSELARKGIARGRSVVALAYADGVLFVAENPSRSLQKISELYDRVGFAAAGRINEFENLRRGGIQFADTRGYAYDRRDVTARQLANVYAQTLGTIFTEQAKPYEVELCVAEGCGLVLMHTRVAPKHKLLDPDRYDDVTADVVDMLAELLATAAARGLDRNQLIVDPGIDYAKTPYQSVEVLRHRDRIVALGRPVLWALSRKDFIGAVTGRRPADRLPGTLAAIGYVGAHPGAVFRVHDVAETVAFLQVQRALTDGDVLTRDATLALDHRRER